MPIHVRVAGSYRPVSAVHVRVAGSYRAVKQVWQRVAGVWQKSHHIKLNNGNVVTPGNDGANDGYYDAGYGGGSGIGSIDTAAFTDVSGVARNVAACYEAAGGGVSLTFAILGGTNSDSIFGALLMGGSLGGGVITGGTEFLRSAASYSLVGGYSKWTWASAGTYFSSTRALQPWS